MDDRLTKDVLMARPIPLTADPANPQSPAGAIPVDLFGVEGGGGGGGTVPIYEADLDAGPKADLAFSGVAYRVGDVVTLSGRFIGQELLTGDYVADVPVGFRPPNEWPTPVSMVHFDARNGSGPGYVIYTGSTCRVVIGDIPESLEGSTGSGSFTATYLTSDPYPESD